jgi:hypothetical protein
MFGFFGSHPSATSYVLPRAESRWAADLRASSVCEG